MALSFVTVKNRFRRSDDEGTVEAVIFRPTSPLIYDDEVNVIYYDEAVRVVVDDTGDLGNGDGVDLVAGQEYEFQPIYYRGPDGKRPRVTFTLPLAAFRGEFWLSDINAPEFFGGAHAALVVMASDYDAGNDRLTDLMGNGLHARFGSVVGADANDPLRLDHEGDNYVYLQGTANNYPSAPDSAALSITGDIEMRMRVAPNDWTPSAARILACKYNATGNQRAYALRLRTDGKLEFFVSFLGTASSSNCISTVAVGGTDGQPLWIRVNRNAATGVCKFYTHPDQDEPPATEDFVQLGDFVTGTAGAIFDSTAVLSLGVQGDGTTNPLIGKIYYFELRQGLIGTPVARFDAAALTEPYATHADGLGNTWTFTRTSPSRLAVVDRDVTIFDTDEYLEVPDSDLLDFAGDFTVLASMRFYNVPAANVALVAKRISLGSAADPGFVLYRTPSGAIVSRIHDGSVGAVDTGPVVEEGKAQIVGLKRAAGRLYTYANGAWTEGTPDPTSSIANGEVLRVARLSGAGTAYAKAECLGLTVTPVALTADEVVTAAEQFGTPWTGEVVLPESLSITDYRAPQGAVVVDGVIYATVDVASAGPHHLLRSTDAGESWTKVAELTVSGPRARLATDGTDTLYVMAEFGKFERYTGLGTTLAASLTTSGGEDPDILWLATDTLVHAYAKTSMTQVAVRLSADNGATWGSEIVVDTAASGTFEDLRLGLAANGDVLLMAENEIVDKGESSIAQWRSTDDGATWTSVEVLVATDSTSDNEGGDYAVLSDGTVVFSWPTNVDGGTTYDENVIYQRRSSDNGATWGAAAAASVTESHVGTHTVVVGDEVILLTRRFHDFSGEPPGQAGTYVENLGP